MRGCKIWIASGEGEIGHRERYTGKVSVRAIKARLTRERSGGDRWARIEIETPTRRSEETTPDMAVRACLGR